jgi:hypothetical protein
MLAMPADLAISGFTCSSGACYSTNPTPSTTNPERSIASWTGARRASIVGHSFACRRPNPEGLVEQPARKRPRTAAAARSAATTVIVQPVPKDRLSANNRTTADRPAGLGSPAMHPPESIHMASRFIVLLPRIRRPLPKRRRTHERKPDSLLGGAPSLATSDSSACVAS